MYSKKWDPSFQFLDKQWLILILLVYLGQLLCYLIKLKFRGLFLRSFVKMRLDPTDSTAPTPSWKEATFDWNVLSFLPFCPLSQHTLLSPWLSFPHTLVPLTQSSARCLQPAPRLHPACSSLEDGHILSSLQVAAICSSELHIQHCVNPRS